MSSKLGVITGETNRACKYSLVTKGGCSGKVRRLVIAHIHVTLDALGDSVIATVLGLIAVDLSILVEVSVTSKCHVTEALALACNRS